MAELEPREPLDRLARLARQEQPPPSDEAAAIMRRVRAARELAPAAAGRFRRGRRAAVLLAASAAAAAAVVFLAVRLHQPAVEPAAPTGVVETKAPDPVVPALNVLESLESEVDQMLVNSGLRLSAG